MDIYEPLNFANIQGYPHNLPNISIDKLLAFQGNNAISVKNHLYAFHTWWAKFTNAHNYEDVQMKRFVLTLEQDAMDWFRDRPDHSIDSFNFLLNAFREKFGDKKEDRFLAKAIRIIKKKENETCEEFNKRFNGMLREISTDYKPTEKMLLEYYLNAFNPDTSYELRRSKPGDYKASQITAEELEKDKKASGKSEIPGFDRSVVKLKEPKGKEKEAKEEPMQKLLKKLESMELNQARMIVDHAKEITTLQSRLIQMERAQMQNHQPRGQNNNNNRNNWQKKGQSSEQRPPHPLETNNLVEKTPPYCRACDKLQEEATCPIVKRIMHHEMLGTSNQINVVGKEYHLSQENWEEVKGNSQPISPFASSYSINNFGQETDVLLKLFGEKPPPERILEIAKDKGLSYQRRNQNDNLVNSRDLNFRSASSMNIDLGSWFDNSKVLVTITEILKIPSQRTKLLNAISGTQINVAQEEPPKAFYQDAPIHL